MKLPEYQITTFIFMVLTILVSLTWVVNYKLKWYVILQEEEYLSLKQEINLLEESIHLLCAEWNSLNSPERLKKLAKINLNFFPLRGSQLISLEKK